MLQMPWLPSKLIQINQTSSWDVRSYMLKEVTIYYIVLFLLSCSQGTRCLKGVNKIPLFPDVSHNLKILSGGVTFSEPCDLRLLSGPTFLNCSKTQDPIFELFN
jgi:hypothetical protein